MDGGNIFGWLAPGPLEADACPRSRSRPLPVLLQTAIFSLLGVHSWMYHFYFYICSPVVLE